MLRPLHSFALVTILQHLMGLAVRRDDLRARQASGSARQVAGRWPSLPVLYDGFEIQLEHLILSDTLFLFIAVAADDGAAMGAAAVWWRCAAGRAADRDVRLVRSTGLPLIPVFAVYLVIALFPRRVNLVRHGARWWRPGRVRIVTAVPVLGYAGCCTTTSTASSP